MRPGNDSSASSLQPVQFAARQPEHGDRPVRRRDPAGSAVVDGGVVAVERVNDRRPLAGRPGDDLDRTRALGAVAGARALRHDARDARQALGAADGLHVLVEDLIGGGSGSRDANDVVLVFERRGAVQRGEARRDPGPAAAAMTRVARHHLAPAEARLVDGRHHLHHPARRHFSRAGVEGVVLPRGVGRGMAVLARHAERGRKHAHRPHELVNGKPPQHADVLEHFFGKRLPFRRRLAARRKNRRQPDERRTRRHRAFMSSCRTFSRPSRRASQSQLPQHHDA